MKQFIKSTIAISIIAAAANVNAATTSPAHAAPTSPAHAAPTSTTAPAAPADAASTPAATTATGNATNVSAAERSKIESVVHQYLLSKPEVLVEALQILQQRQMEEAKQTVKQTQQVASSFAAPLFHQSTDPVAGNPNGKVTIVEFFDYQCPHCVDMAPVMDAIIKANPNVRVVYKDFPIRGPMSEAAARAALAANLQGKYAALSHALLNSKEPLSKDVILKLAKENGLDVTKLQKDMNSPEIDKQLKATMQLAQDLKLFGTPALFIANTDKSGTINYVPGQADQGQLQVFIDQANK